MLHGSGKGACMGYTCSSKSFSGWMYMFCLLGGGGGERDYYLQGFGGFSVVDWLSDDLLVGRSQKESAADLRELLVTFLWKMTLYRRSVCCSSQRWNAVHLVFELEVDNFLPTLLFSSRNGWNKGSRKCHVFSSGGRIGDSLTPHRSSWSSLHQRRSRSNLTVIVFLK